ncbi:MAG: orotidine-5'-phosphate decarboxylase [Spirochaetales bacterium]|nr:orotidine-5'-phosphate decarboxylase [Spirochaetales bacterium]
MKTYIDLLRESAKETGNITCMGLDPKVETLPESDENIRVRLNAFYQELFHRMKIEGLSPAAFKPNIGYYTSLDRPRDSNFLGTEALCDLLDMLEVFFPNVPVILDSKRGDIATSSANYAEEAFTCYDADSVTVSPYMGSDSVFPFCKEGKGVYMLNRTSNPGGAELQNLTVMDPIDEKEVYPFYIAVAHLIANYSNKHKGIGAVVGATNMTELKEIAQYYKDKEIPLLIPGVGSQGGSALDVIAALKEVGYPLDLVRINSSSGLTHPWKKGSAPDDWLDLCLSSIRKLLEETTI